MHYDEKLPTHLDRVLAEFLTEAGRDIRRQAPDCVPALDALTAFVVGGGKRLRPTFAWWAWRGVSEVENEVYAEQVLRAIASLELVQACALIHDDLIDDSDSRRGAPTVHISFAKKHANYGWLGLPESFGSAAAILVGDLALSWADDMFSAAVSSTLPVSIRQKSHSVWQSMRTEVLVGQYLDIRAQASGATDEETALRVAALKTAAYTVQRPLQLGATLADAPTNVIDDLRSYGEKIGVAFQLRDDLLGIFGNPTTTGKPAGDDLREGKRTLLLSIGLRRAKEQRRHREFAAILESIGDPALAESDVDSVREALITVGAVDVIEERIARLTRAAHTILHGIRLRKPATQKLAELAIRATQRTY